MPDRSIAVVIPTFNRGDLLPKTLDSVFAQTLKPAEVIVVDDGSTDGTAAYLDGVDVVRVENRAGGWGPARARNEGLKRVSSPLIAFLDSDDLLLPTALAQLDEGLAADPAAPFAFGRSLMMTRDRAGWHPTGVMTPDSRELRHPLQSLFARNYVPSAGTLLRLDAVSRIGGYPTKIKWAEDHYFWIRLAEQADPVFVPAITSIYRVHAGNRHAPARAGSELTNFLALAVSDPRLEAALPWRLGVHLCTTATAALRQHDWSGFRAAARSSLSGQPAKPTILRSALRHWRARRRWHDAGLSVWQADDQLRFWLSRY
jgi:glycosyltransferase involved in cell wall biosynthesis